MFYFSPAYITYIHLFTSGLMQTCEPHRKGSSLTVSCPLPLNHRDNQTGEAMTAKIIFSFAWQHKFAVQLQILWRAFWGSRTHARHRARPNEYSCDLADIDKTFLCEVEFLSNEIKRLSSWQGRGLGCELTDSHILIRAMYSVFWYRGDVTPPHWWATLTLYHIHCLPISHIPPGGRNKTQLNSTTKYKRTEWP